MRKAAFAFCCAVASLRAQEASSGFELRSTIATDAFYDGQLSTAPRDGQSFSGGFRGLVYPTWKLSSHWTVSGAIQARSRPYFAEDYETQGYGARIDILQANLSYSQFWKRGSLVVKAGQLSSTFGSYLPRYDPATNPLIHDPSQYGYYQGVSLKGLAGVEADATFGQLDLRAQFANSSPANPRSIFDKDQYGNWAGGAGYTISQGFRVGVSAYRGPYLDRHYPFFFPGEAPPRTLPASGYGIDVQWGRGSWNVYVELQKFQMTYKQIRDFNQNTGYGEIRKTMSPRWYLATRIGYQHTTYSHAESYEMVAGYRPNRHQIIKFGYMAQQGPSIRGTLDNSVSVQFITAFRVVSLAKD